jgi:hypothetical protein
MSATKWLSSGHHAAGQLPARTGRTEAGARHQRAFPGIPGLMVRHAADVDRRHFESAKDTTRARRHLSLTTWRRVATCNRFGRLGGGE